MVVIYLYSKYMPMLSFESLCRYSSPLLMFKIVDSLIFVESHLLFIIWVWILDLNLVEFRIWDMYAKWHVTNRLFFKFYSFINMAMPTDRFEAHKFLWIIEFCMLNAQSLWLKKNHCSINLCITVRAVWALFGLFRFEIITQA